MSWMPILALALAAFALLAFVLRAPRNGWEVIGAALLLGIAGYGFQGHPGLAGSPKMAAEQMQADGSLLIAARQQLSGEQGAGTNSWMMIADGMMRNGRFGDAAVILRGAVKDDPKNADAWVALGNALAAHAEGNITAPSLYAFRRAAAADPDHPGPPFFIGLAMLQQGRFDEGRAEWKALLDHTPADAPFRADLAERIGRLDAMIAAQQAMQAQQ